MLLLNLLNFSISYDTEKFRKGAGMDYSVGCDIELVQELLGMSRGALADASGLSLPTLNRWINDASRANAQNVEAFYAFAYGKGVRLNAIKAQLYREDYFADDVNVLFHGSKSGLEGPISVQRSRANNDFGKGFYCGESFEQSAMFVSRFAQSSVYALAFARNSLSSAEFKVDSDWMMAIALYRGRLSKYACAPELVALRNRVESADYVVAPIADNRMYEIIDALADGEITDEQCRHALAATDLGNQYVLRTEKAVRSLRVLEHCYLCEPEKAAYLHSREESSRIGRDKVKAAKREYRGRGLYIDEVLDEND